MVIRSRICPAIGLLLCLVLPGYAKPVSVEQEAKAGEGARPLRIVPVKATADGIERFFAKEVDVFGVKVFATKECDDRKVLHAAAVLAEYLDNDEDGRPDNPDVIRKLLAGKAGMVIFKHDSQREKLFRRMEARILDRRITER